MIFTRVFLEWWARFVETDEFCPTIKNQSDFHSTICRILHEQPSLWYMYLWRPVVLTVLYLKGRVKCFSFVEYSCQMLMVACMFLVLIILIRGFSYYTQMLPLFLYRDAEFLISLPLLSLLPLKDIYKYVLSYWWLHVFVIGVYEVVIALLIVAYSVARSINIYCLTPAMRIGILFPMKLFTKECFFFLDWIASGLIQSLNFELT